MSVGATSPRESGAPSLRRRGSGGGFGRPPCGPLCVRGDAWRPAQPAQLSILLCIVLAALCAPAAAHDRSVSYSSWEVGPAGADTRAVRVTVRVSELELSRVPWPADDRVDTARTVGAYLHDHLEMRAGGAVCATDRPPRRVQADVGRAAFEWHLQCPPHGALEIRSRLLLDAAPSHLHFARVRIGGGTPREQVLSAGAPSWAMAEDGGAPAGAAAASSFSDYVALGVEHIVTGYDHLAFLLALLLLQTSLLQVAEVVTGFTVAHSITLALAVLGYVRPPAGAVEALIGLSIALVAIENVWIVSGRNRWVPWLVATALAGLASAAAAGWGAVPATTLFGLALFAWCYFELVEHAARPELLRWAVAFVFGLVHGFGFAAVLVEAQLPPARLASALFGFNVGVELGQLAVVLLVWPLLRHLGRRNHATVRAAVIEYASAAVCGLGLFWFVARAFG